MRFCLERLHRIDFAVMEYIAHRQYETVSSGVSFVGTSRTEWPILKDKDTGFPSSGTKLGALWDIFCGQMGSMQHQNENIEKSGFLMNEGPHWHP